VPSSGRRASARVEFDELAWSEDLVAASASARVVAEQQRQRLERDGQAPKSRQPSVYQRAHRRVHDG
jgi:hypothetical protein